MSKEKMRTRAFTDKNGVQKTITEINVDNLEMLDSKPTSPQQQENKKDDDLPF